MDFLYFSEQINPLELEPENNDGEEESGKAGVYKKQAFKTLYFGLLFHDSLPCGEHESYLFSAREHKMSKTHTRAVLHR